MADSIDKVRENKVRRMADRQGLRLVKSPRRDPLALDHGTYRVQHADTGDVVAQGSSTGYGLDLDEVERFLTVRAVVEPPRVVLDAERLADCAALADVARQVLGVDVNEEQARAMLRALPAELDEYRA